MDVYSYSCAVMLVNIRSYHTRRQNVKIVFVSVIDMNVSFVCFIISMNWTLRSHSLHEIPRNGFCCILVVNVLFGQHLKCIALYSNVSKCFINSISVHDSFKYTEIHTYNAQPPTHCVTHCFIVDIFKSLVILVESFTISNNKHLC